MASSSGTGHDAAEQEAADMMEELGRQDIEIEDAIERSAATPMPDLPVAAPDHAAHDFVVLRNTSDRSLYFLDEQGYYHDTDCRGCRIDTLLVERQQDKERIERAREALGQIHDHADAAVKGRDVRFSVCVGIRALARDARAALAVEEDAPHG